MSTHLYTMVEDMREVQGFLEKSRDLLYILVHRLIHFFFMGKDNSLKRRARKATLK